MTLLKNQWGFITNRFNAVRLCRGQLMPKWKLNIYWCMLTSSWWDSYTINLHYTVQLIKLKHKWIIFLFWYEILARIIPLCCLESVKIITLVFSGTMEGIEILNTLRFRTQYPWEGCVECRLHEYSKGNCHGWQAYLPHILQSLCLRSSLSGWMDECLCVMREGRPRGSMLCKKQGKLSQDQHVSTKA